MHIFVFEWVTGGGTLAHVEFDPLPLVAKGRAMALAVAADFHAAGHEVTLLRDTRVPDMHAEGCTVIDVASHQEYSATHYQLLDDADATLLIAPETDGILSTYTGWCTRGRSRLISPGRELVRLASDKISTNRRLRAAGIPAPASVLLYSSRRLPKDFGYPAVVKPLDGAGSVDTRLVNSSEEEPGPSEGKFILEQFVPGTPVSVSLLCGPQGATPLPPTRQNLSTGGSFRYLGGEYPLPPELAARATRLAVAAINAMPPAIGYVGVDLVLGDSLNGSGDAVIEVNPRLTTSYAGLRSIVEENLAEAMLAVAEGKSVSITPTGRPVAFANDGAVRYL